MSDAKKTIRDEDICDADCYAWDRLNSQGQRPNCPRPFGPSRDGSAWCESGSIASGGKNAYCTCDTCF